MSSKKRKHTVKCIYTLNFYINLKDVDFFKQLCEFFVPREKK